VCSNVSSRSRAARVAPCSAPARLARDAEAIASRLQTSVPMVVAVSIAEASSASEGRGKKRHSDRLAVVRERFKRHSFWTGFTFSCIGGHEEELQDCPVAWNKIGQQQQELCKGAIV
jgi:hypothetical protein